MINIVCSYDRTSFHSLSQWVDVHLPPLIIDLAIILGVAALVTFLFRLIKQPVVIGYIVAGVIVGPFGPPMVSVVDVEGVKVWADLGVIFFMFALGLEFSFRRLMKVGVSAGLTAALQIGAMITTGYACALALSLAHGSREAIFIGCMVAIPSTTIIIKTFEELGLKTRRFAELVYGILIVGDLAAILMLVALTNIATSASISAADLLLAAAKLGMVVTAWLLVGLLVVPRVVKVVSKRGSSEMLIVVSLGLCLALVCLSAYFNYSVALGAFIMGSILAETKEARRIEGLVAPLKDVFGAIFFVSVGMLLDPRIVAAHLGAVALLCLVVIAGNILFALAATLVTGQTLATAIQASFSLAQIGEFSFIIAVLGISYRAIDHQLYPIIVAVSLITSFTTPYLIRAAPSVVARLERHLPVGWLQAMGLYSSRLVSWSANRRRANILGQPVVRWCAATIVVVGALSAEFFSLRTAAVVTLLSTATILLLFRRRVSLWYQWLERLFFAGISGGTNVGHGPASEKTHDHLVPWDAHLAPIDVGYNPLFIGKTLIELALRERFGISIMVIKRGDQDIVSPGPHQRIYPQDILLCFGTDQELMTVQADMQRASAAVTTADEASSFILRPVEIPAGSPLAGKTIRDASIRDAFGCMVVGIERDGRRLQSPKSDVRLQAADLLWLVGEARGLQKLQASRPG